MKFPQLTTWGMLRVLILMIAAGWIWYSTTMTGLAQPGVLSVPQAGFNAPDFQLSTLNGQEIRLSEYRGKVVLVNIWASWCPPCRAEMPAINTAYNKFKDRGFVVLGIDSTTQDSLENVQSFASENKLDFPILLDKNGEVTKLYDIHSLPTSYFIRRDGTIDEVVIGGPMAEALLTSRVESLLQEMP